MNEERAVTVLSFMGRKGDKGGSEGDQSLKVAPINQFAINYFLTKDQFDASYEVLIGYSYTYRIKIGTNIGNCAEHLHVKCYN